MFNISTSMRYIIRTIKLLLSCKVLSKNVTTQLLKVVSETIESQKIAMTDEEAVILYKKIGDFI